MSLTKCFYRFLIRKRIEAAERIVTELEGCKTRADKEAYQIKCFNSVWKSARRNVPFYKDWGERYSLPDEIGSLDELEKWPVLTKADLRNLDAFKRSDVPEPKGRVLTGGSTGEPVRLPVWEDKYAGVSQMLGRKRYGVEPGDRTFLLWGHEHLYGTGFKRKINIFKRCFKDWLAGWTRFSAYDLGECAMKSAYEAFSQCRPEFVIGFSPAVLSFVRQNQHGSSKVKGIKTVLCTAGPLTDGEKQEIETFFGAPVSMEYGSVECGIMAYTRPSDGWTETCWNTHLLQAQRQSDGEYKNLVTRLTDCYVPLIRYDIGDYLDMLDMERSVLLMRSIKGRPSEMLHFACGVTFFGALIGDCVKQIPEVVSSQIAVDEERNVLEIRVTANEGLTSEAFATIKNRFALTVADADRLDVRVIQVDKLYTTVGGKTPRVVRL